MTVPADFDEVTLRVWEATPPTGAGPATIAIRAGVSLDMTMRCLGRLAAVGFVTRQAPCGSQVWCHVALPAARVATVNAALDHHNRRGNIRGWRRALTGTQESPAWIVQPHLAADIRLDGVEMAGMFIAALTSADHAWEKAAVEHAADHAPVQEGG